MRSSTSTCGELTELSSDLREKPEGLSTSPRPFEFFVRTAAWSMETWGDFIVNY